MKLDRIIFFLIIFSIVITSFGVPLIVVQITLCVSFLLVINNRAVCGSEKSLLVSITLLSAIDKLNDLFESFQILRNIGPILYVFLFVKYLLTKSYKNVGSEIRTIFYSLCITAFVDFVLSYLSGVDFRAFSSDVSVLLLFAWILIMWYGKGKFLATLGVAFVTIFLLESRTIILSMLAFLLVYFLWDKMSKGSKNGLRKFYIACELLCAFLITGFGIWVECFKNGMSNGSSIFSGHGVLWGLCLEHFISGNFSNFLFGFPSTPETYKKAFDGINLLYSGNDYIANYSERSLLHGNFHNSFIYYLYNTGVIGLSLLTSLIIRCLKNNKYKKEPVGLFSAILFVALLNGQSLTSIYIISTIFIMSMFYKFPPSGTVRL